MPHWVSSDFALMNAKIKAKEIKAEARDLMDTAPNPETGEDMAATMRKVRWNIGFPCRPLTNFSSYADTVT